MIMIMMIIVNCTDNVNDDDDDDDMICLQVIAATPSDHSHCSETGRSLSAASDNPQYLRVFSE